MKLANLQETFDRCTYDLVNTVSRSSGLTDLSSRRDGVRALLQMLFANKIFFHEDGIRFDVDDACVNEEGFLKLSQVDLMKIYYDLGINITPIRRKTSLVEHFQQRKILPLPPEDGNIVELTGNQEGVVEFFTSAYQFLVLSFADPSDAEGLNKDGVILLRKGDWIICLQADGVGKNENVHLASQAALRAASASLQEADPLTPENLDQSVHTAFDKAKKTLNVDLHTTLSVFALQLSTGFSNTYNLGDHLGYQLHDQQETVLIDPQNEAQSLIKKGARPDSPEVLWTRNRLTASLASFDESTTPPSKVSASMGKGGVVLLATDGIEGIVFAPFSQPNGGIGTGLFPAHACLHTLTTIQSDRSLKGMAVFLEVLERTYKAYWEWYRNFGCISSRDLNNLSTGPGFTTAKCDDVTIVVVFRTE